MYYLEKPFGIEWSENPFSFPHCNGQARCWMHIDYDEKWCECVCKWCKIARFIRRDGKRMNNDLEFLKDPGKWPLYPIVPLKRYVDGQSFPEFGVLMSISSDYKFFRDVTIYDRIPPSSTGEAGKGELLEKLISEGWQVD